MENLNYFIRMIGKDEPSQINLIERDISGGRISKHTIDSLSTYNEKNILTVSGLTQDTFEYLIQNYGKKFRVINFWKCPLVHDFSAMETLSEIEYITYFWNQRVEKLWNIKKTPKLKGFGFDDFTRLHNLDDLANADQLLELEFGDKVWVKYELETLDPIGKLKNLKTLHFTAKRIIDGRIEPLASLKSLESISFPTGLFTTEQIAWLKTKLSPNIESKMLNAFWTIDKPIEMSGKKKNTFIIGKRKPFLDSEIDKKRIDKYVNEFDRRVKYFIENPDKKPEEFV